MSACFVPLWNFRRIHSPGALKLEEAEVMERQRIAVPAGREFLCRRDILGVPGVLDGLSHVVSDVQKERGEGKTMALEESCCSDILVTALHLFVGNDKKKWFHPLVQTWHLLQSAVKLEEKKHSSCGVLQYSSCDDSAEMAFCCTSLGHCVHVLKWALSESCSSVQEQLMHVVTVLSVSQLNNLCSWVSLNHARHEFCGLALSLLLFFSPCSSIAGQLCRQMILKKADMTPGSVSTNEHDARAIWTNQQSLAYISRTTHRLHSSVLTIKYWYLCF